MDIKALLRSGPPTALITSWGWREIVQLQIRLESDQPDTAFVHLRGAKMRTAAGFFDEIAAALQFPVWFGANWDAIHDIVRDLSWLSGTVMAVYDAEQLLVDGSDEDRAHLADFFETCNRQGDPTAPAADKGEDDGFHVLCQVPKEQVAAFTARWQAAHLSLAPFA